MARHIEDNLQESCVSWFSLQFPQYTQLLFHIPNGGYRNKLEAARFKRMGVRAGVADLMLCVPNREYHGLFIELKAGKGKQSETQVAFQKSVTEVGYKYIVCRSIESFVFELKEFLRHKT